MAELVKAPQFAIRIFSGPRTKLTGNFNLEAEKYTTNTFF